MWGGLFVFGVLGTVCGFNIDTFSDGSAQTSVRVPGRTNASAVGNPALVIGGQRDLILELLEVEDVPGTSAAIDASLAPSVDSGGKKGAVVLRCV